MFVEDYMTPDPTTIGAGATLAEAQALMQSRRIRHLPVLDENKRLVGILSERILQGAIGYDESRSASLTVGEVMAAEPVTISSAAALHDALSIFYARRIGALPVVDCNRLVGIITRSDILRAFFEVLGLDQPGRCLEIALPNGPKDLEHAFGALTKTGKPLLGAVVSRMRRDGGEPSLYIRIPGNDLREVEQKLRDAANIVLAPERPRSAS